MLKLNKIKEFKVWIFITGLAIMLWKAMKYGENKEKLKNYKQNEKIKKSSKKNFKKTMLDSANNARKWLHNKKNRRIK